MYKQYKVVLGTTEYDPVFIMLARNELAAVIGACHRFGIDKLEAMLARKISIEEVDIDPDFREWAAGDAYCNNSIESINNLSWVYSDYLKYEKGTQEVRI